MNISEFLENFRSSQIYNRISERINEFDQKMELFGNRTTTSVPSNNPYESSPKKIITVNRLTKNRRSISIDSKRVSQISKTISTNRTISSNSLREETHPSHEDNFNTVQSKVSFCTDFNRFLNDSNYYTSNGSYKPNPYGRHIGHLDPKLYTSYETEDYYDIPAGHFGRIWFSISYSKENEDVELILHKARNLRGNKRGSMIYNYSVSGPSGDDAGSQANSTNGLLNTLLVNDPGQPQDCRVKIFLDSNEKKYQTTQTQKHTSNPDFEEKFILQCPWDCLSERIVHLQVQMLDKMKRWRPISYVLFPLSEIFENNDNKSHDISRSQRIQRDLLAHENVEVPQVFVSLSYFPVNQRITVGIFECKNMPKKNKSDIYLKVSLCQGLQGREIKSRKTDVLNGRQSFNESFQFTKIHDPNDFSVKIVLYQHGIFDKQLASIFLGNRMVSKGNGSIHWEEMIRCGLANENTCSDWHEFQNSI